MSLRVTLIDKISGTIINTDNYHIFVDESIITIKEKLFCAYPDDILYYPNLIKFELKTKQSDQSDQYEKINNTSSLLFNYDSYPYKPTLYVSNIISDIESDSKNVSNIISAFLTNESELSNISTKYQNEYKDLSDDDFEFIVKLLYINANDLTNAPENVYVDEYLEKLFTKQKNLIRKCQLQMVQLKDYFNAEEQIKDYSKYFDLADEKLQIPFVNFNLVSILVQGSKYESGIKGKFIKLANIFNTIELSEDIPLIALADKTSFSFENPIVKIYNDLKDTNLTDKDIKSWIVNEKKKTNQMFYKKIKGLLIKYKLTEKNFMTVNIFNNGLIEVKVSFEEDDDTNDSLENIIKNICEKLDILIEYINKLQGVFLHSKRLEYTSQSKVLLESVSASIKTNYLINRTKFSNILYNPYISEYVFELKETISYDILSFYYKKFGKKEIEDTEGDRKGITVNVRENPYELNSSIINIYGAYNEHQLAAIAKQIMVITKLYKDDNGSQQIDQKIKEKSHIKLLRKQGVTIYSTKCQKPRQPVINEKKEPLPSSYIVDFQNNKYICPSKDYPYPGFINENLVCCFKKDQRGRDAFIRNIKSTDFETMVSPSNFKIKVKENGGNGGNGGNGEAYETFAIKIISDYIDGLDSNNSMSRYHFLSKTNELISITDKRLIKILEQEEENEMWLESVPLAKIITDPPKNKCNFTPKLNEKTDDINSPCSHHKKNKFFGYNLNAYPCCFDKEREPYIQRKRKTSDITKQHIMTSDKTLDYQRIGILPPALDKLFNEIVKNKIKDKQTTSHYYRMGVVQNNSAILGAIVLALQNKIKVNDDDVYLNNTMEFRKMIANNLQSNPRIFETLNNGNIGIKYNTLEKYIENLLDSKSPLNHNDIIDIVERIANINIIILEIPYILSESTQVADYPNTKIICKNNIPEKSKENPFVILLKRQNKYEVIIKLTEDKKADQRDIEYMYKYQSDNDDTRNKISENIVNFLLDYYNTSCVKENVFPEKFKFNEMFNLTDIINVLKESKHEIVAQLINVYNKVDMVLTKKGLIIPIKESGIDNSIKRINLKQLQESNKLMLLNDYIKGFSEINAILLEKIGNSNKNIEIIGIAINDNGIFNAIYTNFGEFVPIKNENVETTIPILPIKYYGDINEYILNDIKTDTAQNTYIERINKLRKNIFMIKTQLGSQFDDSDREKVNNINQNSSINRYEKIKQLVEMFKTKKVVIDLEDKWITFILKHIANEVINDNKENLLLNNLITSDVFDPTEISKRDTESVLFNIDDIRKWIKKYE